MRRLIHATVTALLGALILVIGPAAPAWACDCAALSPEQSLGFADLAFTGVVVAIDKPAFPTSSADPVQVRFLVESVRKGSPGDHVTLSTALESPSCGYEFQEGMRYEVYSHEGETGLCSGNRALGPAPEVPLENGFPYLIAAVGAGVLVLLGAIGAAVIIRLRRRPTSG